MFLRNRLRIIKARMCGKNIWFIEGYDYSTGISSTKAESINVQVRVESTGVIIEGLPNAEEISIYGTDGTLVYRGTKRRISLQPNSMYILRWNSGAKKILTSH